MDFKIQKMTAFVSKNPPDNDEGVIAFQNLGGNWFPLVGGYPEIVDLMRAKAVEISRKTGKVIYEVEFTNRVDLFQIQTHAPDKA